MPSSKTFENSSQLKIKFQSISISVNWKKIKKINEIFGCTRRLLVLLAIKYLLTIYKCFVRPHKFRHIFSYAVIHMCACGAGIETTEHFFLCATLAFLLKDLRFFSFLRLNVNKNINVKNITAFNKDTFSEPGGRGFSTKFLGPHARWSSLRVTRNWRNRWYKVDLPYLRNLIV